MPRQPRYFIPDIPQHVVIRGIDRQPTFFAADDYELFHEALSNNARRFDCAIHAYVLMTNHVHLLATPGRAHSLPQLMQAMGRDYVQAVNRRYGRTGTLWEGRYKASLVDADSYFLACHRYIELNPVRAGIVPDPGMYFYSSYGSNALGQFDALVHPHAIYEQLGHTEDQRCAAYRRMFVDALESPVLERIRDTTNACQVLGNDRFIAQIETMLGRRVRAGKAGRPKKSGERCR